MSEIVAPQGSPLAVAVVGARDLDASLRFYVDVIGLDAGPETHWEGESFERLWDLPAGARVERGRLVLTRLRAQELEVSRRSEPVRTAGRDEHPRRALPDALEDSLAGRRWPVPCR